MESATQAKANPEAQAKTNLFALDRASLEQFFVEIGEKPFRASQVIKWIYQQGVTDFDAMTNISKALRARLKLITTITPPTMEVEQEAKDGTRKWLMRLDDGNGIEVVFIPEETRGTLCISSQVGCGLNCTFCATARQGFNRNLNVGEIVGQVWIAWQALAKEHPELTTRPISNVVLMGMGEPLMNYDTVVSAIDILRDDFGFGLSRRRITLSTAGMVPEIVKLAKDMPVSLAVSLHAADDELRTKLIPLNKRYPIRALLDACKQYVGDSPRSRITFEYLMLDGINDSDQQARDLAKLLADVPSKINLIPFNPVEKIPYRRSPMKRVNAFRDILMQKGIMTVTRKVRGDDIDAACGQLVGKVADKTNRVERLRVAG